MDKTYSPKDIEQTCYTQWEEAGCFKPQDNPEAFCIMLPPPNVTGSLHMGHGFQHTLMDLLTRYHRMNGEQTLWQPGTDHAGISTQLVVERQLEAKGLSRTTMTRDAFLKQVWQWKATSGSQITRQMRRLGVSVDWSRERFTMDEGLSAAVQKVFIQLHEEGLIYRGTRLVNWDPALGTAVSDLEVISSEEDGFLWHIAYPIANTQESLTVATTRPETLLGDTAVAVHPDDPRYAHLIGKMVELPLCNRLIPIIADNYVDPAFGSGCVKITPAHDFNDYEVGRRHDLPMINIFNKNAQLNQHVPEKYQNLDRFKARQDILEDLETAGLLLKQEPYRLKLPRGEKSGEIIEPFMTEQWYVKIKPLAEPAIDAVKRGEVRFIPDNWTNTYFQWMDNIEDWCISRQLWWGHRIPAWYDEKGHTYVGYSENDIRFKYKLDDSIQLTQDNDVLDTWFSSALWPFSTLGWPEKTPELDRFFPTSVLVTGFDIIFFWVARMIMMSLKFTGKVPFKTVLITGLIRDSEGHKMSKSKGNVLDPIDLIDGITLEALVQKRTESLVLTSARKKIETATRKEYPKGIPAFGTDALRFTYCSLASMGRNIRFDLGRLEGYRNFCNKLWNAARFILLNIEDEQIDFGDGAFQYSPADEWILSKLQKTIQDTHQTIHSYRFDLLAQTLYEFVWHEYCDWYLELSKSVLHDDNALPAMKRGTRRTLIHVLDQILKLLHPMMPYITEAIWTRTSKFTSQTAESIMMSAFPKVQPHHIKPDIETEIDWLQTLTQSVRTVRSEMNISPSVPITLLVKAPSYTEEQRLKKYKSLLISLCKLNQINTLTTAPPPSATVVVDQTEYLIPMAGLINKEAELQRLDKAISKLDKDVTLSNTKLANPQFIDHAPEAIIAKEKTRLAEALQTKEKLAQQRKIIRELM